MHILISNDDGIFANGIRALAKAAVEAGHRVTVVAPDSQRSAASHALTMIRPLHARPVDFGDGITAYAVDGAPADCARLGLFMLRDDPVDCVLSGINNGSNRGAAIVYSGTVAAAMEASMCNVPAVAVSLCSDEDAGYEDAARMGVQVMEWAMEHPLPRGEVYNLNVPGGVRVKGIKSATVSNEFLFLPNYHQLPDGSYMLSHEQMAMPESASESDLKVTQAGYASLSIVTWNMLANTSMPGLDTLNKRCMEHE